MIVATLWHLPLIALLAAADPSAPTEPAFVIASSKIEAGFDSTGTLMNLRDVATGQSLVMEMAEQFSLVLDDVTIRSSDCTVAAPVRGDGHIEIVYSQPPFEFRVRYQIDPDDHFIEKRINIRRLDDQMLVINAVSLGKWLRSGDAGAPIPFQHGQCLTHFVRRDDAGFFFGIRTPFTETWPPGMIHVELAYRVNMAFPPGTTYETEPAFFGAYHPTGVYAPPAPESIKESVFSQIPPDLAESEAMLKMVRKLAPPRDGITLTFNGYQGGLYYGDYGEPDGTARADTDIETLRIVHDMLGPCYVQPAGPWFGAYQEAVTLTPDDTQLEEPAARRKLLEWIAANEMRPLNWVSLKAVHGWHEPRLGPYCTDHNEWQANPNLNCTANPQFMQWLGKIILDDCARGFAGFVADEPGPGLRYQMTCDKTAHGHLPGDASYAYFYQRRELFRQLREDFGPEFELQGQRPHMDAGIWDAIYLNSVFTFLENPGVTAETIRKWSRMRRAYSFVPSYMDQIMVQPGIESIDTTMLSALAVSSNYLFIAPTSTQALQDHSNAIQKDNSVMSNALASLPEDDRKRVRFWLDWARENGEYMRDVIDLTDWPGEGKADGYLRLRDGAGFAFLFNSTDAPQNLNLPLNGQVGLDPARRYRIEPVHAPDYQTQTYGENADLTLPPNAAWLVKISPDTGTQ